MHAQIDFPIEEIYRQLMKELDIVISTLIDTSK